MNSNSYILVVSILMIFLQILILIKSFSIKKKRKHKIVERGWPKFRAPLPPPILDK